MGPGDERHSFTVFTSARRLDDATRQFASVLSSLDKEGAGEAEFRDLLDFVRECRFERLGAFRYSEEEGTYGAIHYKDDIPAEVKQERYDRLMELQSGISLAYNQSRVGTRTRVLVDSVDSSSPAPTGDLILVARSQTESPEVDGEILIKGTAPVGQFVDVTITGADEYDLIAEL